MAEKLNVSTRQVQKYLKRLTDQNLIVKEGNRINGSWKILDVECTGIGATRYEYLGEFLSSVGTPSFMIQ